MTAGRGSALIPCRAAEGRGGFLPHGETGNPFSYQTISESCRYNDDIVFSYILNLLGFCRPV